MGSRGQEIINRLPDKKSIVGVEVGVRYGKNAVQVLQAAPQLHMWLVDTWSKPAPGDSYYESGDGIADRPPGYWRKCWRDFQNRINPYQDRVEILQMLSTDAAKFLKKQYTNNFFDFVFIDADHSYKGAFRDICHWYPLVKIGGWIGGHDYGHPRIGEVKKAVDEVFGEGNVELAQDMTWFMRKKE